MKWYETFFLTETEGKLIGVQHLALKDYGGLLPSSLVPLSKRTGKPVTVYRIEDDNRGLHDFMSYGLKTDPTPGNRVLVQAYLWRSKSCTMGTRDEPEYISLIKSIRPIKNRR